MSSVLVVDDELGYRRYIRAGLERRGVRVYQASDAESAVKILQAVDVDVLIVDVRLPGTLTGLDLAERVRQMHADVGIVVVTGYGSAEYQRRSRELGVVDYLEKPFDLSAIEETVCRFFDRRMLLQRINELEHLVAERSGGQPLTRAMEAWPVVYLGQDGALLYATLKGREALKAVVDPSLEQPLTHIDRDLLSQLLQATEAENRGIATVFRRDGVLSHFTALVRRVAWDTQPALGVLFTDAAEQPAPTTEDFWSAILGSVVHVGGSETD